MAIDAGGIAVSVQRDSRVGKIQSLTNGRNIRHHCSPETVGISEGRIRRRVSRL